MLLPPLWKTVPPPRSGKVLAVIRPLLAAHFTLVPEPWLAAVLRTLLPVRHVARFWLALLPGSTHLTAVTILRCPVRIVEISPAVPAILVRLVSVMAATAAMSPVLGPERRGHGQQCAHHKPRQPPAAANRDFSSARHYLKSNSHYDLRMFIESKRFTLPIARVRVRARAVRLVQHVHLLEQLRVFIQRLQVLDYGRGRRRRHPR